MAIDSVQIRLLNIKEKELCNDFYNYFYHKRCALRQWEWEFELNTFKPKQIPFAVAIDNGRIIGTQALIPVKMIDKNGVFWTAKSEETLVDPEYRGQKLFERMYALLFNYAEEQNFACIWGFTPATKAFERLNFAIPGKTKQLFMPFSQRAIQLLLEKVPGVHKSKTKLILSRAAGLVAQPLSSLKTAIRRWDRHNFEIRTITNSNENFGNLTERLINRFGGITIYRDSDYIRWRFFENPYIRSNVKGVYHEKELLGWVAYALGDDGMGYLVDIIVPGDDKRINPEQITKVLLLEAVIGVRNMGAYGIRGWHVNNHPFDKLVARVAKKIGFYGIEQGHAFVHYNCKNQSKRQSDVSFDEWFISRIFTEGVLG